ncbi:MFS transporter [Paenibacillus sp. HB172176]|uniref:MFS transporter n=1 Tax=Paenibacillus sp. HB172176 TaxID=2493690 RepID=UPI00143A1D48|nr:MFS transporter [Paenibacillus sp. HB172176]
MHSWQRTMWILWFGVLFCSSSYTMSVPFLPLFLLDLGVKDGSVNLWAGVVHSSAFFVGAIMAPLWGMLADKFGKRKMVIRAGLSLAIIYALYAFVQAPWQLVGIRMLQGLVGGFVPASMSIVASIAPKEKLGWSLGMMQAGTMSGGILGPLIGGLLADIFGIRRSFIVAAVIIFAAAIAVLVYVKEKRPETASNDKDAGVASGKPESMSAGVDKQDAGAREEAQGARAASSDAGEERRPGKPAAVTYRMAFRNRALMQMLFLLAIFQLAINMIQPQLALHIADLQGSADDAMLSAGLVLSLIGIAGIVASPIWGRMGERRGYYRVLVFCLLCAGTVVCLQFFVKALWLFAVIQFVFGLFMAGIVPIVNTLMVQNTDEQFRGRSFGMTTSANQLGAMLGPLIGGLLGLYLGLNWIFVGTGVIMLSAGLYIMSSRRGGRDRSKRIRLEAGSQL